MTGTRFDLDEGGLEWNGGVADLVGQEGRASEGDGNVGLRMREEESLEVGDSVVRGGRRRSGRRRRRVVEPEVVEIFELSRARERLDSLTVDVVSNEKFETSQLVPKARKMRKSVCSGLSSSRRSFIRSTSRRVKLSRPERRTHVDILKWDPISSHPSTALV